MKILIFIILGMALGMIGNSDFYNGNQKRVFRHPLRIEVLNEETEEGRILARKLEEYPSECFWRGGTVTPVSKDFYLTATHEILEDFATEINYYVPFIEGLAWTVCVHGFYGESSAENSKCISPSVMDCPTGCEFDTYHRVFKECSSDEICGPPMDGEPSRWKAEIKPDHQYSPMPCPQLNLKAVMGFDTLTSTWEQFFDPDDVTKMIIEASFSVSLIAYNKVGALVFESSSALDELYYQFSTFTNKHDARGVHSAVESQISNGKPSTRMVIELVADPGTMITDVRVRPDWTFDLAHHTEFEAECDIGVDERQLCEIIAIAEIVTDGYLTIEIYLEDGENEWMDTIVRHYKYMTLGSETKFAIYSNLWISPYDQLDHIYDFSSGQSVIVDQSNYWILERYGKLRKGEWERINDANPEVYYRMNDGSLIKVEQGLHFVSYSSDELKMSEIDPRMDCDEHPCYLWFFETLRDFLKAPPGINEDDVMGYVFVSQTKVKYKGGAGRRGFADEEGVVTSAMNSTKAMYSMTPAAKEEEEEEKSSSIWGVTTGLMYAISTVFGMTVVGFYYFCALFCCVVMCIGFACVIKVGDTVMRTSHPKKPYVELEETSKFDTK